MVNVLIPPSIKDPVLRRTLDQIVQNLDGGSGNIDVQNEDPSASTRGSEGDIIYATLTDSIWVFTGTTWSRASPGIVTDVRIRAAVPRPAPDVTYSGWDDDSAFFKNNGGDNKALIAILRTNEGEWTDQEHVDNVESYTWMKNGQPFTNPSVTQPANAGTTRRALIISAADIEDNGEDAFICVVNF